MGLSKESLLQEILCFNRQSSGWRVYRGLTLHILLGCDHSRLHVVHLNCSLTSPGNLVQTWQVCWRSNDLERVETRVVVSIWVKLKVIYFIYFLFLLLIIVQSKMYGFLLTEADNCRCDLDNRYCYTGMATVSKKYTFLTGVIFMYSIAF